jgi:starvation-inducible outer membrane lipoprotein
MQSRKRSVKFRCIGTLKHKFDLSKQKLKYSMLTKYNYIIIERDKYKIWILIVYTIVPGHFSRGFGNIFRIHPSGKKRAIEL